MSTGYHDTGLRSKGMDLDKISTVIKKEGEKGLSLAVNFINKAKLMTGNGYDNLDKGNTLLGQTSGGGQYTSGERFYRINDYAKTPNPSNARPPQKPVDPKATKSPSKPSVDEGGFDLSAWGDDPWDTTQFTDTPAPTKTTENSVPEKKNRGYMGFWSS